MRCMPAVVTGARNSHLPHTITRKNALAAEMAAMQSKGSTAAAAATNNNNNCWVMQLQIITNYVAVSFANSRLPHTPSAMRHLQL